MTLARLEACAAYRLRFEQLSLERFHFQTCNKCLSLPGSVC